MAAVAALPDAVALAREHHLVFYVLEQLAVALLVVLLDGGHTAEFLGYLRKTFLVGLAGHTLVHVGPLEVLTLGGRLQVLGGRFDAALQQFEPHLGVLLLIVGGLLEDGGYLYITVFLGFRGPVGILVAGLALAGKRFLQILLCLGSFQFFHNVF